MASNIKGITIQIEGKTSGLVKSLKDVESQIKKDDAALKQLEKALALDPKNVDLLAAKEAVLADKTQAAASKMQILQQVQKDALGDLPEDAQLSASQMAQLQSEITQTENALGKFDGAADSVGDVGDEAKSSESKLSGLASAGAAIGGAVVSGAKVAVEALAAIGTAATAAVGAIVTTFGKLAVNVVTSYADLEQAIGGSEAVFGEYASVVQTAAEESYRTLGTSEEQYLAYANKTAALFQGSGLSIERSADLTMEAMQRAADMASVMGIDTESALEAINGAAKGNYSMMDNLGVAMNNTTLQAYALSQGIDTAWSSMSNAERAELAMQYFFEQTSQYAGNFEREASETISGSLGMLSASWQSFIAGLGNSDADIGNLAENVITSLDAVITNVTPVVENLVEVLPTALESMMTNVQPLVGPLLDTVTGVFTTLFESFTNESFINQVTNFASQILTSFGNTISQNQGTIVTALVTLTNTLADTLMTLIPVIGPIAVNLINALVNGLLNNIDSVINTAVDLISSLASALLSPDALTRIGQAAVTLVTRLVSALLSPQSISGLVTGAASLVLALVNGLAENIDTLLPLITEAFLTIVQTLYDPEMLSQLLEAATNLIIQLAYGLVEATPYLGEAVVTLIGNIIQFYSENWDLVLSTVLELAGALILAVFNLIYGLLGTNIDEVFGNLAGAGDRLAAWWDGIINNVSIWLSSITSNIIDFIVNAVSSFTGFFADMYTGATSLFTNVLNSIISFFTNIWTNITSSIDGITSTITGFADGIRDTFTDLVSSAFDWGSDLVGNIIDGINSMISNAASAASNLASSISQYLHFSVPEKGPLSDFDESGADMVETFIDSMNRKRSALTNALDSTAGLINSEMTDYEVVTNSNVNHTVDYSGGLSRIEKFLSAQVAATENAGQGQLIFPIYIGQEHIDTVVVDALDRYNYATGGH